jgi:AcrR family transcriptional regulator
MTKHVATLRELKQAAAMGRIQDAAYELLVSVGYEETKVTDIAAAAEVSPSSVYRYFGTKDGVFLWDPLEGPFMDLLEARLTEYPSMEAVERAFLELVADLDPDNEALLRDRTQVLVSIPRLREAMRAMMSGFGDDLGGVLRGAGATDLEASVVAAATAAVLMAGVEVWARPGSTATLAEVTNEAFRSLQVASG